MRPQSRYREIQLKDENVCLGKGAGRNLGIRLACNEEFASLGSGKIKIRKQLRCLTLTLVTHTIHCNHFQAMDATV